MAIESIAASTNAAATSQVLKPQQAEEAQRAQQPKQAEQAAQQAQQTTPPKPVVNTQGQTTGRVVNTSA